MKSVFSRSTKRFLAWLMVLALIALAAMLAYSLAMYATLERLRDAAQHRLDLVGAGLESDLARYEYLPSLLEHTPSVFTVLDAPGDDGKRDELNRWLQQISATAGSSTLYVLDQNGVGVAASDWNEASTPIGLNLAFRPYVQQALAHRRGRFYGVGITSKRPGYYLSYGLKHQGKLRGVAIVKVNLEDQESSWKKLPGAVLLTDENGVVMLSSRPEWKFHPVAALPQQVVADIASSRRFGDAALTPLDWHPGESFSPNSNMLRLNKVDYLSTARTLNQTGWRMLVLDEVEPVRAAARNIAAIAALATAVLLLLATVIVLRQRALHHKLASRAALQAAHDNLEFKVAERTAELRTANAALASEIEMRRAIEDDLRATHHELLHAGKMAALGQMSAGIVHELNQPLGAMRTLSDNACVLLEHDRLEDVRGNLQRIAHLVDRLGRLTTQLKTFAHKTLTPGVAVSIAQAIANAQFVVSHRLREHGVEFRTSLPAQQLHALADEARLEQVLTNLFANAIDAMQDTALPQLQVSVRADGERCVIEVMDSGPGIHPDILPRLFEPFVSSKPAGAGLGLGLMISAHIIREFGGTLTACNRAADDMRGAVFVIALPLVAV